MGIRRMGQSDTWLGGGGKRKKMNIHGAQPGICGRKENR